MKSELAKATWIWLPQETPSKHQYVCFRKSFQLPAQPGNVSVDIAADSDFVLFVNGRELGRGQFSDYPQDKTFSRFDISGALREGGNCLAVLAYHRGEDFSEHRAGRPGLAVALDAAEPALRSDSSWKCLQHPAFRSGDMPKVTVQQGFTTCFDARLDIPWTEPGFDDGTWLAAAVQPAGFWREPRPRPVPPLELGGPVATTIRCQGHFIRRKEGASFAETMGADALVAMPAETVFGSAPMTLDPPGPGCDGAWFIVDLGEEQAGLLSFDLDAPAGAVLDIAHGEHVHDGRVRARLGGRNFADRYLCRGGRNSYTLPFRRLGGRFLEVHVSQFSEPVAIRYFGLLPLSLPGLSACRFQCSDSLAEGVHGISLRTLTRCMHEHYEDTPWREQSLYAFDGRNQALYGYYAFGNYGFAATSFELLGKGLRDDGLLELCAPAKVPVTIPIFSLVWITALAEHWTHSGSPELFQKFSGQIKRMLDTVFSRRDDKSGLFLPPAGTGIWNFYEWTPGLSGQPYDARQLDAPYNLFLHEALRAYAQMLELSGESAAAVDALRAELGLAIAATFWDAGRQCLSTYNVDGVRSGSHQLTQCLALHENILDADRERALLRRFHSPDLAEMTLSSMVYLVRGLMDKDESSREAVETAIRGNWDKMLLSGASTCWETIKGEADFAAAGSLCHGWSALPVYYHHACVLGIRPLSPGFKTFAVAPCPGRLCHASGEVMTPHGKIAVEWRREGRGIELSLSSPPECEAVFSPYPESGMNVTS